MIYNRAPIIDALGVSKDSKVKRAVPGTEFYRDFKDMLDFPGVYVIRPRGELNKGVSKLGKAGHLGNRINQYNKLYPEGIDVVYAKGVRQKPNTEQGKKHEDVYETQLKREMKKRAKLATVPLIPDMIRSTEMHVANNATLAKALKKTDATLKSAKKGPPVRQLQNPLPRTAKAKRSSGVVTRSMAPPENVPWFVVADNVKAVQAAEARAKAATKKRVANRPRMCPCPT